MPATLAFVCEHVHGKLDQEIPGWQKHAPAFALLMFVQCCLAPFQSEEGSCALVVMAATHPVYLVLVWEATRQKLDADSGVRKQVHAEATVLNAWHMHVYLRDFRNQAIRAASKATAPSKIMPAAAAP